MIDFFLAAGLKLIVPALGLFSKRSATLKEWEERSKKTLEELEARASVPSHVRDSHKRAKDRLDEKWEEAKGKPKEVSWSEVEAPHTVTQGALFIVKIPAAPHGAILYADKIWILTHAIASEAPQELQAVLMSAGKRELNLQVNGYWAWSQKINVLEKGEA